MDRVKIHDDSAWHCHTTGEVFEYCDNYDVKNLMAIMKCGCRYFMLPTPGNLSMDSYTTEFNVATEKCKNTRGNL